MRASHLEDLASEAEDTIIRALVHEERREILRIVGLSNTGVSYTELLGELGIPTGKLNYQLRELEGLLEKDEKRRYALTPLGKKAVSLIIMIRQNIDPDFDKYVTAAKLVRRSSLQPLTKSLLLIGIVVISVVLAVFGLLTYVAVTEGAPVFVYTLLPVLMAIGFSVLGWLLYALKSTPEILKRMEGKLG